MSQNKKVNLSSLKSLAMKFADDAPIRVVLLSEPDEMDYVEYCHKAMVWWKLVRISKLA